MPVGSSTRTMLVGGRTRSFRMYRPTGLRAPAALVVMLHGGGGSARGAETRYGRDPVAARSGFLVAYPDGVGRRPPLPGPSTPPSPAAPTAARWS
ncbi:hypothetical protein LQ327_00575 [Actinomycetospora endophytica]|uniref:Esterase n=1 Tax=Actinomycetospora endophytica TaxID=2291215 RepID=A0ABS8P0W1_9PSEU|nr:hypothetical protein [Actinomycetospora endophytica]MCD2191883.1 hypothetical protein [Actinomycetospora endophytica]